MEPLNPISSRILSKIIKVRKNWMKSFQMIMIRETARSTYIQLQMGNSSFFQVMNQRMDWENLLNVEKNYTVTSEVLQRGRETEMKAPFQQKTALNSWVVKMMLSSTNPMITSYPLYKNILWEVVGILLLILRKISISIEMLKIGVFGAE